MVEGGIKRYRELDILEWIYYVRLEDLGYGFVFWKGLGNIVFIKVIRDFLLRGVLILLR